MKPIRPPLHPKKTVPSLPAQSPGLSQVDSRPALFLFNYFNELTSSFRLSLVDVAVIELLFLYGLRISEALNIRSVDLMSNGLIRIKGKKGSNDRFVAPIVYSKFWFSTFRSSLPISTYYSRFYFYRLFKKLGFFAYFNHNKNLSVTHFFRHRLLELLKSDNQDLESLSNFIGHKSKKSILHYVK